MTSLIGHADTGAAYMLLNVRKWLGEIIVEVSVPGAAYDFAGMLFKLFLPESVSQALNDNLFAPVKTMFMNGLKMVVAPGVSGAGLVCLSVLLTQLNVPVEAVGSLWVSTRCWVCCGP